MEAKQTINYRCSTLNETFLRWMLPHMNEGLASIVSENNMLNVVLGSLMNQFQKDHPCEIKYIT